VVDDVCDGRVRSLVGPHRVHRLLSPDGDAVVAAVPLVGTVRCVICRFEQRRVDILEWDVLNRWVVRLMERQRVLRVGDNSPRNGNDDSR
jgi:hypothetical protein